VAHIASHRAGPIVLAFHNPLSVRDEREDSRIAFAAVNGHQGTLSTSTVIAVGSPLGRAVYELYNGQLPQWRCISQ